MHKKIMKRKIIIAISLFATIMVFSAWYFRSVAPALIANMPPGLNSRILIHMLRLPDDDLVMSSAYHLGKVGDSRAYMPLVRAINHPTAMVRHNAINAMIALGQPDIAADATAKCIRNKAEESFVIDSGIALLSKVTTPENKRKTVEALIEYLPRSTDFPSNRQSAERLIKEFSITSGDSGLR